VDHGTIHKENIARMKEAYDANKAAAAAAGSSKKRKAS